MPNPFFSVITVTYNSSQFVRDAIESVLASTFTDFELIIGDDCSTDNTWEIINEYNDARIVNYRNETNLREYPNRNKALGMVNGEWVIFIDGDDIIYTHSLSVLNLILQNYSDVAIAIMCPENKNYIPNLRLNPTQLYEIEFSEFGLINRALSHTVYKSDVLKENFFETEGFIGLDTLNRLQILMTQDCLLVHDNLTWWRESPNQASKKIIKSLRNEMYLMSKYLFSNELCPLTNEKKLIYIKNTKIKLSRIFLLYFFRFKFKKAIKILIVNDLNIFDLRFIFCKINYTNPIFTIDQSVRYDLKRIISFQH